MSKARTIKIFLPNGEPTGIKILDIHNRTIEATYIPRIYLDNVKEEEHLQGVGIYFLVGEEDVGKAKVYIGEAENVAKRLLQHNAQKDFWNYAITITSNNRGLTKTHIKFLEWLCYSKAKDTNRIIIENSTIPNKPHLQRAMEADLHDNFEDIELLISTLGLPIFTPLIASRKIVGEKSSQDLQDDEIFYISTRGAAGRGIYSTEGFVGLAGSKFTEDTVNSFTLKNKELRNNLIENNLLIKKDNYLILQENYKFNSPSEAASIISGREANGWTEWKLENGKTLDDVYRKSN